MNITVFLSTLEFFKCNQRNYILSNDWGVDLTNLGTGMVNIQCPILYFSVLITLVTSIYFIHWMMWWDDEGSAYPCTLSRCFRCFNHCSNSCTESVLPSRELLLPSHKPLLTRTWTVRRVCTSTFLQTPTHTYLNHQFQNMIVLLQSKF